MHLVKESEVQEGVPERMQEVGLKQILQKSRKRNHLLVNGSRNKTFLQRGAMWSPRVTGDFWVLYTLYLLTLLVLNCTPWMGCVCHLSAFYLTVALNNSSSVLPGLGVECISLDHSLDPFHHENRKQREVKRRQEQKEKIGGCTYPALLSLVTLNAHKIQPTLLW